MDILSSLSESKMFRSKNAIERLSARQAVDLFHMHFCALAILLQSRLTERWAKDYAKRTIQFGSFGEWRTNSTEIGILGWSLLTDDVDFRLPRSSDYLRSRLTIDEGLVIRWLKTASTGHFDQGLTKRIFSRIDLWLKIDDETLRAIRRLAQDWDNLDLEESQLVTTRLLQLFRAHGRDSEILLQLTQLANAHGLELRDVCNPETGECPTTHAADKPLDKKKNNLFAKLASVAAGVAIGYKASKSLHKTDVNEDATAGATSAGAIAPVVGALGGVQRRSMPTTIAVPDDAVSKRKTTKKKAK